MLMLNGDDLLVVNETNTNLFQINEVNSKFEVKWHQHILQALKSPRYAGYFSGIDLVRKNAEATINAHRNKDSLVNDVIASIHSSVMRDMRVNALAHQCFWELGL
ncbi:hypothetical protein ACX818_001362 [Acinetobacter baumannii]